MTRGPRWPCIAAFLQGFGMSNYTAEIEERFNFQKLLVIPWDAELGSCYLFIYWMFKTIMFSPQFHGSFSAETGFQTTKENKYIWHSPCPHVNFSNAHAHTDTQKCPKSQGPVVQSVVSLTSSLRVISLTVLADSIYNILIFFAEKMWVAFAVQKLLTFF